MAKTRDQSHYTIHIVVDALDILERFRGDGGEQGASEIAHALGISKNSTVRLLATLEKRGYVEKNPLTERFQLGLKALELRQSYLRQGGLLNRARPMLETMMAETGETVYLVLLKKAHIVYAAAVESKQAVRVVSRLGTRLPAYCTASGKAHLAFLPEEHIDKLYPNAALQSFTPQTLATKSELKAELQAIAARGYSVDNEEFDREVRCVAVPVFDHTGGVAAAISISGPSFRLSESRITNELVPLLVPICAELSRQLGYIREI